MCRRKPNWPHRVLSLSGTSVPQQFRISSPDRDICPISSWRPSRQFVRHSPIRQFKGDQQCSEQPTSATNARHKTRNAPSSCAVLSRRADHHASGSDCRPASVEMAWRLTLLMWPPRRPIIAGSTSRRKRPSHRAFPRSGSIGCTSPTGRIVPATRS